MKIIERLSFLFCLIFFFSACSDKASIKIDNLRCELLTNPEGIDILQPRLSWEISSDNRGLKQQAYHILVASSLDKLNANEGDLWDSEEISSDKSVYIEYAGNSLNSRTECYWKVKITTNQGKTEWSSPSKWSMGLLNDTDWQAQWIGLDCSFENDVVDQSKTRLSARYFRKKFSTPNALKKATIYISGLGLYKLFINGEKIGDQELAPTLTDYSKSVKYNTFDVTNTLLQGENVISTVLGNGRFFSMRPPGIPHVLIKEIPYFFFPAICALWNYVEVYVGIHSNGIIFILVRRVNLILEQGVKFVWFTESI